MWRAPRAHPRFEVFRLFRGARSGIRQPLGTRSRSLRNSQTACKQHANSMQTVCEQYANSMRTVCKQYANSMQTVCKQYANSMEPAWSQYADPMEPVCNRHEAGKETAWDQHGHGGWILSACSYWSGGILSRPRGKVTKTSITHYGPTTAGKQPKRSRSASA
jgi:hypothetical protein